MKGRVEALHQVRAAVLGAPGAGTSTYLRALQDAMASGAGRGAPLEPGDGVLLEPGDGALLEPGDDAPPDGTFVYAPAARPLAEVRWTDLGAAEPDPAGPAGSTGGRSPGAVAEADAIILVLDGAHFRRPMTSERRAEITRAALVQRMSAVVAETLDHRSAAGRRLPALTVLITKADLIEWDLPGARRRLPDLVAEIRALLPVAFHARLSTAVCPVSARRPGGAPDGARGDSAPPGEARPFGVHVPLIFSLAHFYRQEHRDLSSRLDVLGIRRAAIDRELMSSPFTWVVRNRRRRLETALRRMEEDEAAMSRCRRQCAAEADRLIPMLRHLAIYDGGRPAGWAGSGQD